MTTVYDISLQAMKQVTDVLQGTATDGSATYLKDVVSLIQPNQYYGNGTLWIRSGTHINKVARVNGHANNQLTFDPFPSVLCVQQVETVTVLGSVTGSGNAAVVVTALGMVNSPKTIAVAVLNGDSASSVGGKIRTALAAEPDVKNFFDVSGSGANVILTTKSARANDTTLTVTVDNWTCTGLTFATSVNTTAGVAGPRYAVARSVFPWEQALAAIQSALDETKVTGENETLTGNGTTLEFDLLAGVFDIVKVELERPSAPGYQPISTHWHERPGTLRFDYGYAPNAGDVIHIFYRKDHDEITNYDTVISAEIDRDWLALTAAKELLFWGLGMYSQKKEMMLEDRLNKTLNQLKGKRARIEGPHVIVKTGGG